MHCTCIRAGISTQNDHLPGTTVLNSRIECTEAERRPTINDPAAKTEAATGTLTPAGQPGRSGHTSNSPASMVRCAPGRTRTDTSDPFRGAASALGLRGLANNTPQILIFEGPPYSDQQSKV